MRRSVSHFRSVANIGTRETSRDAFPARRAYSVEKLSVRALIPNLAEQNSDLLKFQWSHRVQSAFCGMISKFFDIGRCGKGFLDRRAESGPSPQSAPASALRDKAPFRCGCAKVCFYMRVFRTVKLSTSSKATFPEPRQFFLLVELVRHVRGDLYTICGRAMCLACWLG